MWRPLRKAEVTAAAAVTAAEVTAVGVAVVGVTVVGVTVVAGVVKAVWEARRSVMAGAELAEAPHI